jgi:dihydroorotate dehydrogenase
MYRSLIRPLLFTISPERIHHITFRLLQFGGFIPGFYTMMRGKFSHTDRRLERKIMGITFPNPVGLAAGFDKDAKLVDELSAIGFGFIEIGTLTPLPQPGNPQPRLFRLPLDQALVNRMGFNNGGTVSAVSRLRKRSSKVIVGGNIGKNKVTPNENAVDDYVACFETLYPVVDYFVVNVSSPNTPGLRALQEKEPLSDLLTKIKTLSQSKQVARPVLLKIAPDLTDSQLDDVIEILKVTKTDGVIATNTTISREGLLTSKEEVEAIGAGGLSGKPVAKRSSEVIAYLRKNLGQGFPIIGVGGIMSEEDALDKLRAGADLIQIYTGFIYEGPGFVKRILKAILREHSR